MPSKRRCRAEAHELLSLLPALPQPWDVEELCRRLADLRERPILLHEVDNPAFPLGLWYDDGRRDHIFYCTEVTGDHRDHVILHELCHLLAGHGLPLSDITDVQKRTAHTSHEEKVAELFATFVLRRADQVPPRSLSPVEQRASELLGASIG